MTLVQNSSTPPGNYWKLIPGWCITVLVINVEYNRESTVYSIAPLSLNKL